MQNQISLFSVCFLLVLLLNSCQFQTVLDDTFSQATYPRDYVKLQDLESISMEDLFYINYAIVRQRDYYNYQIEGKTYREILEMAKTFRQNGLPVEEQYHRNGQQDILILKPESEGMGMIRKGESSRLKKVLNFSCSFENTTNRDVVIASVTFLLKGPFKDHLSTVGYELNCIVNKGQKIDILFFADASNITRNLLFNRPFKAPYTWIDEILYDMTVEVGGATVELETAHFKDCMHYSARIEPHQAMVYKDALEGTEWQLRDANGQVTALKLGNSHFIIEYSDQPVDINDFLK